MTSPSPHDFTEEIAVQDRASEAYRSIRYLKPHSREYHLAWTRNMLKDLSLEGRILDNGCGTGLLLELLSGRRVVGLDLSPRMVEFAAETARPVLRGDSLNLPFPDRTFEVVLARSLLHHLPDKQRGVDEIARVLKPEGRVVFADTNRSLLSVIPRRIANRGEHFASTHQNLSRSVFVRLLRKDFVIERVEYFGFLAYPLAFPDLIDFSRYVCGIDALTRLLTRFDDCLSRIPVLRTQAWGILVRARRTSG